MTMADWGEPLGDNYIQCIGGIHAYFQIKLTSRLGRTRCILGRGIALHRRG
jgi:hypothetical protein